MSARLVHPRISAFLRQEGFYLPIVLLAVALSLWPLTRNVSTIDHGISATAVAPPASLRQVLRIHIEGLRALHVRRDPKAVFPLWIRRAQISLMIVGIAVGLTLVTLNILRGRRPKLPNLGPPAWSLWDCFKLAAFWHVGRLSLHAIFRVRSMPPAYAPGYWMAELFGATLLTGVLAHIIVAERGASISDIGLHGKGSLRGVGAGVLALLILIPCMGVIAAAAVSWFPDAAIQDTVAALLGTPLRSTLLVAPVALIVFVPLAEELFYRGMVQPVLQRWLGGWKGLGVTALFFAAAHVRAERNLHLLLPLFVLGAALGYLYNRTRSLAAPITLHALYNGFVMLLVFSHRQIITQLHAPT